MSTRSAIERQIRLEKEALDASLARLSRDIGAYLEGPKEVKIRIQPKYDYSVKNVAEGDRIFNQNLTQFTAMKLNRAFGYNKGMRTVYDETVYALVGAFGSNLEEYELLSAQVICHLIMKAAENMGAATFATNDSSKGIALAYKCLLGNTIESNKGIVSALSECNSTAEFDSDEKDAAGLPIMVSNPLQGKVYEYLRPLNLSHIESISAKYRPRIESRDAFKAYIANKSAIQAVSSYIIKKTPSSDVLLPALIDFSSASTDALRLEAVNAAFAKYPEKDVVATFKYYEEAVKSQVDLSSGIRVGEVDASLNSAAQALESAAKSVKNVAGVESSVKNDFSRQFSKLASEVKKIKAKSSDSDELIIINTAKLIDLIGGGSDFGTAGAAVTSALFTSTALASQVTGVLKVLKPEFSSETSSDLFLSNVEYLNLQDKINPESVASLSMDPNNAVVQNEVIRALLALNTAYDGVMRFAPTALLEAPAAKFQEVTDSFKKLLSTQITTALGIIKDQITAFDDKIDKAGVKEGVLRAVREIFGVISVYDSESRVASSLLTADTILDSDAALWVYTSAKMQAIADGRMPSQSEISVLLEQYLDRTLAASVRGTKRRATVDFVLYSSKILSDAVEGARVTAQQSGIQIRQNPRENGMNPYLKNTLVGTGTLAGEHLATSGLTTAIKPVGGSIAGYAIDATPSLAVAGAAWYLEGKGTIDTSTRNSILVGSAAHLLLRSLYKYVPGVRFSDNMLLKGLGYVVNGEAKLVGDLSMAPSAAFPASLANVEASNIAEYICNLAKMNAESALPHIAIQLCVNGAVASTSSSDTVQTIQFSQVADSVCSIGDAQNMAAALAIYHHTHKAGKEDIYEKSNGTITVDLAKLGTFMTENPKVVEAVAKTQQEVVKIVESSNNAKVKALKDTASTSESGYADAIDAAIEEANVPAANGLGAFILEPGYNMDVYSGADQVHLSQPAPRMTSASGISQLDSAIMNAEKLTAHDKMQEGIGDLMEVAVIRVHPSTAHDIENAGMGVSLGMSRSNPAQELVALEVEGDNGLMSVAPARQHSVPQGALTNAKIGHAPNIDVSPHGLFNKGAFSPLYGR